MFLKVGEFNILTAVNIIIRNNPWIKWFFHLSPEIKTSKKEKIYKKTKNIKKRDKTYFVAPAEHLKISQCVGWQKLQS